MHTLMVSLHQTEPEHRVLAASLLLQLDMMVHTLFATQIPQSLNKHLLYKPQINFENRQQQQQQQQQQSL